MAVSVQPMVCVNGDYFLITLLNGQLLVGTGEVYLGDLVPPAGFASRSLGLSRRY